MENGITEQNMQHAVSVDATCNSLLALHNKAKLKPMLPANKQFNHNILLKKHCKQYPIFLYTLEQVLG